MARSKVVLDDAVLDRLIRRIGKENLDRWIIHDGVEYGAFVELGTTQMKARPALAPAFERNVRALRRALGQAVERIRSLNDVLGKVAFDIQEDYQSHVPVDTATLKNSISVSKE